MNKKKYSILLRVDSCKQKNQKCLSSNSFGAVNESKYSPFWASKWCLSYIFKCSSNWLYNFGQYRCKIESVTCEFFSIWFLASFYSCFKSLRKQPLSNLSEQIKVRRDNNNRIVMIIIGSQKWNSKPDISINIDLMFNICCNFSNTKTMKPIFWIDLFNWHHLHSALF